MAETSFGRFFAKFSILTVARLAGALAAFAANLLIARHFGAKSLGEYSFILSIAAILGVVFSLGFSSVATVFAAELKAKDQQSSIGSFLKVSRQEILVLTLMAGIFGACFATFYPEFLGGFGLTSVLAIIGFAMVAAFISLYSATLIGLGRQMMGMLPEAVVRPFVFLFALIAAAVSGFTLDGHMIFHIALTSAVLAFVVLTPPIGRLISEATKSTSSGEKQRWRKSAYPWTVSTLVWDYFIEVHIILAGLLIAPVQVAILHVCFRFRVLAGFGMRTLYALLMPDIVGANAEGRHEEVARKLQRTSLISIAYGVSVMVGFWLLGDLLLMVFGEAFAAAKPILLAVSSTILVRALFGPAPSILSMSGFQVPTAVVMATCLVLSVVVSLLVYTDHGILGIALSYAGANAVASVVLWFIAKQRTGFDGSVFCLLKR